MPINQDQFLGSNANLCVTYHINVNVAIVISNFHQKCVVVEAMRRSGVISKMLLIKKSKSKVYVSFLISLYSGSQRSTKPKTSTAVEIFDKQTNF